MSKILIITWQKANQRLLADYLGRQHDIVVAPPAKAETKRVLQSETFDLGIVDGPALNQYASAFETRKSAEAPLFLPVLLITPRKDVRMFTRHLWRAVDDLIISPIEKVELQARVEILLRARHLSLELEKRNRESLQTSEARYRHIFEGAAVSIWEEDLSRVQESLDELKAKGVDNIEQYLQNHPDFVRQCAAQIRLLDVNQASLKMFEANSKEDLLISLAKTFSPETLETFTRALTAFARHESRFETEAVFQTFRGRPINVLLSIAFPPPGSPFQGTLVSMIDITERKQAQGSLRQSEERYRLMLNTTLDGFILADEEGQIMQVNPSYCDMIGYSEQELLSMNIRDLEAMLTDQEIEERIQQMVSQGKARFETRHRARDGHLIDLEVSVSILHSGDKPLVAAFVRDITERKLAEKALKEREEKINSLFNGIHLPVFVHPYKSEGFANFIEVNDSACEQYGYSREELLKLSPKNISLLEDARQKGSIEGRRRLKEEGHAIFEGTHITKHGKRFPVEMNSTVFDWAGQKVILSIAIDITERKKAEEELRVLETAIDNAQECIMVSDRENRLTYVNRAFETLTGYSAAEALGNTPGMLKSGQHDRAFYQKLKKTIYAGHPWQGTLTLRKKNGEFYKVYATITPICDQAGIPEHFVSIHRDVTEERKMERRMQQTQRLEAIGTLAGGIAHDFNNLLTPITGYTELCMLALPDGSKAKRHLEAVMQAAGRAADLVQQILAFSRRSNHERKPLRVTPIVKEALKLLRATIPTTIDIRQDISVTDETVIVDPTEIHQVVMNLCINASHAMPDGGTMHVGLHAVDLDRDTSERIPGCTPGRHVQLSVEDTGHGIAPEILDRIFEPYFTTKEAGKGTGLGLATVHAIVTACGGGITVYSEPGQGTRFNIYLPVAGDTATEAVETATLMKSGHERILLIDDDPTIVELGKDTLEAYGYTVTTSTDPVQALERFKKAPGEVDMVITDMTMPGMAGDQLAAAVLAIRPELPIVVCTGFSERINKEKAKKMGIRKLLGKPVAPSALLSTIREILDREE